MAFEENLRSKISASPYSSPERNVFKVVLGEIQQKSASGKISDEACFSIVKKMMKGNEEVLTMKDSHGFLRLSETDERRQQYIEENAILSELLPKYWDISQILNSLTEAQIDVKSEINEGKATGKAMAHLKSINAPVEGQTVKEAVQQMRK